MANKTIKVDLIARVEGEGALDLRIKDGVTPRLRTSPLGSAVSARSPTR